MFINRHWKLEKGVHKLYFSKNYASICIAELMFSKKENDWEYIINAFGKFYEKDWLFDEELSIDEAKELIEDMIDGYFVDEMNYYSDIRQQWNEER